MSKELVVSSTPHETRLAILENDQLVEIYIERESQQGLAGSIHKGRVTRVLPGMQSAFVDVGLERDAFLYVTDFYEDAEELENLPAPGDKRRPAEPKPKEPSEAPEVEAAPAETQEAGGERPRRGRRGRRGRRRQNRRGGFPDSKYASFEERSAGRTPEPQAEAPPPEPERASRPSVAASDEDASPLTVLPGESLAKYHEKAAKGVAQDDLQEDQHESRAEAPKAEDAGGPPERRRGAWFRSRPSRGTADETERTPASRGSILGLGLDRSPRAEAEVRATSVEAPVQTSDGHSPASPESGIALEDSWQTARVEVAEHPEPEPGDDAPREALEQALPDESDESPAQPKSAIELAEEAAYAAEANEAAEEVPEDSGGEEGSGDEQVSGDGQGPAKGSLSGTRAVDANSTTGSEEERPQPAMPPSGDDGPERSGGSEARVRGRSRSSRYLQRRGRRGRRGSGRRRESGAAEAQEAPSVPREAIADTPIQPGDPQSISNLLSKGREILVQISKEPLGRKGARITSYIALPGRYLVYMPTVDHVGVSRKIASDGERSRLRSVVQTHRTGMPGGFIIRTAGQNASEEEIRGDMLFLYNLWLDIREKAERRKTPGLIHQDLDIVERILRDQLGEKFKNIWVDSEEEYERILRFVERFQPELLPRVKLYTRAKPVFDEFNVTGDLEKALRPKVWLKSGGYIVINQTEALVAIDVNTGKYVGKSDRLEDTIVNTNLEAVKEIVRQVRLRDLGGIIVVDFIDMDDRKNRQKVMAALELELRYDSAPSKSLQFNDFGLIAITRRRVKQSLERALCSPCPNCHGSGSLKSVQTVTLQILEEARKVSGTIEERQKDMTLRVNPEVARFLKSRDNTYLQEIEEILRTHVLVRSDQSLHREHFDIN